MTNQLFFFLTGLKITLLHRVLKKNKLLFLFSVTGEAIISVSASNNDFTP